MLFHLRGFYEKYFIGVVTHVPAPFFVFTATIPDTRAARK
jgi:hypothetical protein